jgi:hypothetical protein
MIDCVSVQTVATIVVAGGIIFAGSQAWTVRKSFRMQTLDIILRELGSEEQREARRYVIVQFSKDAMEKNIRTALDLDSLGPCNRKKVEMVLASFNRVGFVIRKEKNIKRDLMEFIGGSAIALWGNLKAYALAERERRGREGRERNYLQYFEEFAEESKKYWQT